MSDAMGNPGEPVAEVDPDDLKTLWQEARNLQSRLPGQNVAVFSDLMRAICKPGANTHAAWYRLSMIWVLNQVAQEQLAPWIKDEEISDAVFRTMATIPMEWVGHTEREGLPFDVEKLFSLLKEGSVR